MGLMTYADLTAPSKSTPARKVAEVCITRMQGPTSRMPPLPLTTATPAEIADLQGWVSAGLPQGSCAGIDGGLGAGTSPYNTPLTCTSHRHWTAGTGYDMRPGEACISCHQTANDGQGLDPQYMFTLAGTVYPTAHEDTDCDGVGGATVVISDAAGKTYTLQPDSVGNFSTTAAVTMPIHAKVVRGQSERAMAGAQTTGDCNSCHTPAGTKNAPGRIMTP